MTTTVTVSAHCDPKTTKVEVQILEGDQDGQNVYIEDGNSADFIVYHDRKVIISEVPKD